MNQIYFDQTKRQIDCTFVDTTDSENVPKKYQGQWRFVRGQKVKDGLGILIWPDGSKYQGQFVSD